MILILSFCIILLRFILHLDYDYANLDTSNIPESISLLFIISGGSGSGKTTLCREIAGQNPTSNVSKGTLGTLNRKLLAVYYVQVLH